MSAADQPSNGGNEAKFYLIFLKSIPGKPLSPEVIRLHAAHLAELDMNGKLVLAGPVPECAMGLIVLRTASATEAKVVADEDPLIQGGYQTYEIGTWLMSHHENGYQPNLEPEVHK
jgi:uncharacterized protein YciI